MRALSLLLLLAVAGCATEAHPVVGGVSSAGVPGATRWDHVDGGLVLADGVLYDADEVLADEVIGAPALCGKGDRLVVAVQADGVQSAIVARSRTRSGWGPARVLHDGPGRPERVALSPDGLWVAYVSAPAGERTVFVLPFEGGAPQAVPGPVPPSGGAALRFDGDELVWVGAAGTVRVPWRG